MTTIEAPTVTTSASTTEILTLKVLRERYRTRLELAKRLGLAEWFLKANGSEKKWLAQFKPQFYDKEAQPVNV